MCVKVNFCSLSLACLKSRLGGALSDGCGLTVMQLSGCLVPDKLHKPEKVGQGVRLYKVTTLSVKSQWVWEERGFPFKHNKEHLNKYVNIPLYNHVYSNCGNKDKALKNNKLQLLWMASCPWIKLYATVLNIWSSQWSQSADISPLKLHCVNFFSVQFRAVHESGCTHTQSLKSEPNWAAKTLMWFGHNSFFFF